VQCSNSLVEAHFKVLKYNYLYRMSVADGKNLTRLVSWISNDFNNRPHISLNGLTPNERQDNAIANNELWREAKKTASMERKRHNMENRCKACLPRH